MNDEFPFLSPLRARAVSTDSFGQRLASEASAPIRLYDTVESTFITAEDLLRQNALPEWGSVLAAEQTHGVGQHGRQWVSPKGNVYATIRLPKEKPFTQISASPILGGMMASALTEYGLPIWLKWPNDLIIVTPRAKVPHRKVGGILIKDLPDAILAGVGINVTSSPDDDAMRIEHAFPAGCLPMGSLNAHNLNSIVDIWIYLVASMRQLFADGLARNWKTLVDARLLSRGDTVEVNEDGDGWKHSEGRLLGIDDTGGLRLLTGKGIEVCMTGSMTIAKLDQSNR